MVMLLPGDEPGRDEAAKDPQEEATAGGTVPEQRAENDATQAGSMSGGIQILASSIRTSVVKGVLECDPAQRVISTTINVGGQEIRVAGVFPEGLEVGEMSRYITVLETYHASEGLHPFYQQMVQSIIYSYARSALNTAARSGMQQPVIVEAGAGTGLVTEVAAKAFPDAIIFPVDIDTQYHEFLKRRTEGDFRILQSEEDADGVTVEGFPANVIPLHGDARHFDLPGTGAVVIMSAFHKHHIPDWDLADSFRQDAAMLKQAKRLYPGCEPIVIVADENISEKRHRSLDTKQEELSNMHAKFIRDMQTEKAETEVITGEIEELIELMSRDPKDQSRIARQAEHIRESDPYSSYVVATKAHVGIVGKQPTTIGSDDGMDAVYPSDKAEWAEAESQVQHMLITLKRRADKLLGMLSTNEESSMREGIRGILAVKKFMKQAHDAGVTIDGAVVEPDYNPSSREWEMIKPQLAQKGLTLPRVGECKRSLAEQNEAAKMAGLERQGGIRVGPTGTDQLESGGGVWISIYQLTDETIQQLIEESQDTTP